LAGSVDVGEMSNCDVGMTPTFDYRPLGRDDSTKKVFGAELIKSTVESFRTPILKLSHSSYELQQNSEK
jgi:hypothetical protein